jgi:hypothetical protein
LPGYFQTITRPLLDHCQTTARLLPDHCYTIARRLLDYCQTIARQLLDNCQTIARPLLDLQTSIIFPFVMPSIVQLLSDIKFKSKQAVYFIFCITPHHDLSVHENDKLRFDELVEMFPKHVPPSSRWHSHCTYLQICTVQCAICAQS